MQGVAGFIKDGRLPADIHMSIFVAISFRHDHVQTGRLKR